MARAAAREIEGWLRLAATATLALIHTHGRSRGPVSDTSSLGRCIAIPPQEVEP
jgi:hypothetical protein